MTDYLTARDAPGRPHDEDAERRTLCGMFLSDEARATVRPLLREGDFYVEAHADAYRAICRVADRGEPVNFVTVGNDAATSGDCRALVEGGGKMFLSKLVDDAVSSQDSWHFAERVASLANRRRLQDLGVGLSYAAGNGMTDGDLSIHVAEIRDELARLTVGQQTLDAEDLAAILARPAPPAPMAIPELGWAEGDVSIVSGPGGIGKTWLTLAVGLALASGRRVFERYDVTRPYRVAFLDLESRPWETDARLRRLAGAFGEIEPERFRVIRRRLRLDDPRDLARLVANLRTWGTEFLLVDSLRRAVAGDLNRAEVTSGFFVNVLDRIRLELGTGIVLTDHTRKATGDKDLDAADQALIGSVDKRNMADAHFGVERRQERLAFVPTKTRHARLPEPILLELRGLTGEQDDDGPMSVVCVGNVDRASDKVQDAIVAMLDDAGPDGLLRGEIVGRAGYSARAVDDALRALKTRGRVDWSKVGKQMRYALDPEEQPQRPQTTATGFKGVE